MEYSILLLLLFITIYNVSCIKISILHNNNIINENDNNNNYNKNNDDKLSITVPRSVSKDSKLSDLSSHSEDIGSSIHSIQSIGSARSEDSTKSDQSSTSNQSKSTRPSSRFYIPKGNTKYIYDIIHSGEFDNLVASQRENSKKTILDRLISRDKALITRDNLNAHNNKSSLLTIKSNGLAGLIRLAGVTRSDGSIKSSSGKSSSGKSSSGKSVKSDVSTASSTSYGSIKSASSSISSLGNTLKDHAKRISKESGSTLKSLGYLVADGIHGAAEKASDLSDQLLSEIDINKQEHNKRLHDLKKLIFNHIDMNRDVILSYFKDMDINTSKESLVRLLTSDLNYLNDTIYVDRLYSESLNIYNIIFTRLNGDDDISKIDLLIHNIKRIVYSTEVAKLMNALE